MITPARMAELSAPAADQVAIMASRLRQVLHEETTHGERAQVLLIWTAIVGAYSEVLEACAKDEEMQHITETLDLTNLVVDGDSACQAAAQEVVDAALARHSVKLNPLEG